MCSTQSVSPIYLLHYHVQRLRRERERKESGAWVERFKSWDHLNQYHVGFTGDLFLALPRCVGGLGGPRDPRAHRVFTCVVKVDKLAAKRRGIGPPAILRASDLPHTHFPEPWRDTLFLFSHLVLLNLVCFFIHFLSLSLFLDIDLPQLLHLTIFLSLQTHFPAPLQNTTSPTSNLWCQSFEEEWKSMALTWGL